MPISRAGILVRNGKRVKSGVRVPCRRALLKRDSEAYPLSPPTTQQRTEALLAVPVNPRLCRLQPRGLGVRRPFTGFLRIPLADARRPFSHHRDRKLTEPVASLSQLDLEGDAVQLVAVFLLIAAAAVEDPIAGPGINGRREQRGRAPAEHFPAATGSWARFA